jgi:ATP-binding cassette subfamily B protein
MRGKTTVVVAQRISTVLTADKILVLDRGRVVAEGAHAELMASSSIYREIFDSQLGGGPAVDSAPQHAVRKGPAAAPTVLPPVLKPAAGGS